MPIVRGRAQDNSDVAFDFDEDKKKSGAMKDVYFAPDRSYVVQLLRRPADHRTRERLQLLTGLYRERIFNTPEGDYWRKVFCWPTATVEYCGRLGLVAPAWPAHFFFEHGSHSASNVSLRGEEKQGKWFASAWHQNAILDPRERGDWRKYLHIGLNLSRAVRRLHMAGLAHSDLSYRNVLLDPTSGAACMIDIDGLVVPDKFPPDVLGTADFIAPEVLSTMRLSVGDPKRFLPRRETDNHALATLLYMYLLNRHPLKGRRICDFDDEAEDERLSMGERALFIEDPSDSSNRPTRRWLEREHESRLPDSLPCVDPDALPYTKVGRPLAELFKRAFCDGLHVPAKRPTASEFESAILRTLDELLKCTNANCRHGYFAYDDSLRPSCPFCGTQYSRPVPVLTFYRDRGGGRYVRDDRRLVICEQQSIFRWHVNSNVEVSERTPQADRTPLGYVAWHEGGWVLVNQGLSTLKNLTTGRAVALNEAVTLASGLQLQLDATPGGRVAHIQIAQQ